MTVQEHIIADYLSAYNLNKTAFNLGLVTEEGYERAYRKTLQRYAEMSCDEFDYLGIEQAKLDLMAVENEEAWIHQEYGYMARTNN